MPPGNETRNSTSPCCRPGSLLMQVRSEDLSPGRDSRSLSRSRMARVEGHRAKSNGPKSKVEDQGTARQKPNEEANQQDKSKQAQGRLLAICRAGQSPKVSPNSLNQDTQKHAGIHQLERAKCMLTSCFHLYILFLTKMKNINE